MNRIPGTLLSRLGLFVLGLGITAWILLPMIQQGYPSTHSTHFNLSWAFQYQRQFLSGQWYPRWLEFSNLGFGNATFVFYPPLCMVATLPWRIMGFDMPGSLVASMGLAILLFATGLYVYARCFFPVVIAVGVAGAGVISPYFLSDIYQRGAIGEVWAIVSLPWILWASEQIFRQTGIWPVIRLGLLYGCLVLSHLPTLLMVTLTWIIFPVIRGWQNINNILRCYLGLIISFLWTAIYLWPATVDQRFIQVESVNFSEEYQPQYRLMIKGLLQLRPQLADHWYDKGLLPFWGLLIGIAGIMMGILLLQRNKPLFLLYWVGTYLFSLLMMTDILSWIYAFVIPLQRIQFSWRWMTISTVFMPLLLGFIFDLAWKQKAKNLWSSLGLAILGLGLMGILAGQGNHLLETAGFNPEEVALFADLADNKEFPQEPQSRPGRSFLYWHWIFPDGLGLVDVPEYRATGVVMGMPTETVHPLIQWAGESIGELTLREWQFGKRSFLADNPTTTEQFILLRTFYYPAWETRLDGSRILTEKAPEGQIQVRIPPGRHEVSIVYTGTMSDKVGQGVSFLTLLGIGICLGQNCFKTILRRTGEFYPKSIRT